jgi:hypothetical protein
MAWFILILVLLAAAFGVLAAVLKLVAIFVLTMLLSIAVIVTVTWWVVRGRARSFVRRFDQGRSGASQGRGSGGQSLPPAHDDRY